MADTKKILVFSKEDITKELIEINGILKQANVKKELVLKTEGEQAGAEGGLQMGGVRVSSLIKTTSIDQQATINERVSGSIIPEITKTLPQVQVVSDISAGNLRTFCVYVNGIDVIPLFAGALTGGGADVWKKVIEKDRKGFAIYNNSGYPIYMGEHTDPLLLQKNGFIIPSGQGFSDALYLANLNVIADASLGALFADIRVWITSV